MPKKMVRLDPLQVIVNVQWVKEEHTDDGGEIGPLPPECPITPYTWGTYIAITILEFNAFGDPNFPFDTTPIFPGYDWWEGGGDGMSHVFVTFGYEPGGPTCPWSLGGCDPLNSTNHPECFAGSGDPATNGDANGPPTTTGRDDVEMVGPGSDFGGYDW